MTTPISSHLKDKSNGEDMTFKLKEKSWYFISIFVMKDLLRLKYCSHFPFKATCNANSKTYTDGQEIVYHTVMSPILSAECSTCTCSAGSITGCNSRSCDIGLSGVVSPELCDNWITGIEGVCCPRCGKEKRTK